MTDTGLVLLGFFVGSGVFFGFALLASEIVELRKALASINICWNNPMKIEVNKEQS